MDAGGGGIIHAARRLPDSQPGSGNQLAGDRVRPAVSAPVASALVGACVRSGDAVTASRPPALSRAHARRPARLARSAGAPGRCSTRADSAARAADGRAARGGHAAFRSPLRTCRSPTAPRRRPSLPAHRGRRRRPDGGGVRQSPGTGQDGRTYGWTRRAGRLGIAGVDAIQPIRRGRGARAADRRFDAGRGVRVRRPLSSFPPLRPARSRVPGRPVSAR